MRFKPSTWDASDMWGFGFISAIFVALVSLVVALVSLVGLGTWALYSTINAKDGNVEYCYTEYFNPSTVTPPTYIIRGFVPWRSNIVVGIAPDEATAEALKKSAAVCNR